MARSGRPDVHKERCKSMISPKHFLFSVSDGVATITFDRPDKRNALTFESYAELSDTFRNIGNEPDIRAIVITGAGGNFCSGGDVQEIISPVIAQAADGDITGILKFARLTGDVVVAMRSCPQPIVAAVDGVCVGAGAVLAMASDIRLGTARAKVAFLFAKVGLCGADMGACAILPRIIGAGRAAELLMTGRVMPGDEAGQTGFFNRVVDAERLASEARELAGSLAAGPVFAHGMTKKCLHQEWAMSLEQAIEAEAQAQAICMMTKDFARAYEAIISKTTPVFAGD